jgi:hypothetical protein
VEAAADLLGGLERRAQDVLGASGAPPPAETPHLAALEGELRAAGAQLAERGELRERGHPVLADLAAFRDLAAAVGAREGAARAEELARALVDDYARAERAAEVAADDPDACFRALARARALDLEALARTGGPAPLRDARAALRDRLLVARRVHPPSPEVRDLWARDLLDRADVVLSSLDDFEPARAAELAELVAGDLAWHRDEVERRGRHARALGWRVRRLRAEAQERDLQARLEARFGRRNVARFERAILALTLLVLGLLAAEWILDLPMAALVWIAVVDTAACLVFLWEIAVKLRYARDRGRWFLRHLFVDILPSIPFALLVLHHTAYDAVKLPRAFRLFRLARVGRYLYLLRPFLRLGRAFGFLSRGVDRLVRGHARSLNRDIVLYPTREERARLAAEAEGAAARLRHLEARVQARWLELLAAAGGAAEEVATARVAALAAARERGDLRARPAAGPDESPRDAIAEDVLRRLDRLAPAEAEAALGQDVVARLARVVRTLSLPPLRWFPVLRRYVPRLAEDMGDAQVVAAAARAAATELRRLHGRWLSLADLHGTITPAQFVDRVGTAMIKVSFRPAYRLVLFALIVLVFRVVFEVSGLSWLDHLSDALFRFVGILGSICLALLGIGWWLRRIAGEATAFFEQAARAQYLALTETIKGRTLERDARVLERRTLVPERLVHGEEGGPEGGEALVAHVRRWLVAAEPGGGGALERVLLPYRDGLDGGPFTDSDTRTTSQLLGNPALRNLRAMSRRFTVRDHRQLQRLDLERPTALFGGPYFWFRLMCRAIAHGVARLIVDYNRHALPLAHLAAASGEERGRFEAWLRAAEVAEVPNDLVRYATTGFTALHFLDDDARRDDEVAERFGPLVLERLRRDRRLLFRRVFGTYPAHKLPREDRVLNPYRLYQRWLAGGRALLLPLFLAWGALRRLGDLLAWLRRCVRELKGPSVAVDVEAAEGADFACALRKIRRARGPVAEAALRVRIRFDPEYLGLRLPGTAESGLEGSDVASDLRFLDADAALGDEVDAARARAERDLRRLATLLDGGLMGRVVPGPSTREHLRAVACAYHGDLDGVRSLLSGRDVLAEVAARAAREGLHPRVLLKPRLFALFRRYWEAHGEGDRRARRAAWRAIAHDVDGAQEALRAWGEAGAGMRERGERVLADLVRHPERITGMLVTLRTVQTLSLLDILLYREHVYRLGRYAESGDPTHFVPGTI